MRISYDELIVKVESQDITKAMSLTINRLKKKYFLKVDEVVGYSVLSDVMDMKKFNFIQKCKIAFEVIWICEGYDAAKWLFEDKYKEGVEWVH